MVNCPICKEELTKKTDDGWICENCNETIPFQLVNDCRPSCGCGHEFTK
jgi:hypothetical protein